MAFTVCIALSAWDAAEHGKTEPMIAFARVTGRYAGLAENGSANRTGSLKFPVLPSNGSWVEADQAGDERAENRPYRTTSDLHRDSPLQGSIRV
jgi:hypothetical protein